MVGLRRKKAQSSQGVRKGGRGGNTQDEKRREPQSREDGRREQAEVKQDVATEQNRKTGNAGGGVRDTDKGAGRAGKDARNVGGSRPGRAHRGGGGGQSSAKGLRREGGVRESPTPGTRLRP